MRSRFGQLLTFRRAETLFLKSALALKRQISLKEFAVTDIKYFS